MPPEDRTRGELAAGDALGPYRIEQILGEGAVGIVYRAIHEPTGDRVALKILKSQLSGEPSYRARFDHEARAARELEHPHLVRVVDVGEIDGRYYIAARYLGGGSLQERIAAEGPLSIGDTVRLASEVASALDALHSAGLVHRDVKPANIVLDEDGSAGLTDFGLAKGPAYTALTRPGQFIGTVEYIAPELVHGDAATPASDLYSLGCVVYECIAGTPPFASDNVFETITMHVAEEPPDLAALRSDLPAGFTYAVSTALAKEPDRRPPTGRAFSMLLAAGAGRAP